MTNEEMRKEMGFLLDRMDELMKAYVALLRKYYELVCK